MAFPLIVTLVVLVLLLIALASERIPAEVAMLMALLALVAARVITMEDALKGFSNEAILTISGLFVVSAGLQATGAVEFISRMTLGAPKPGTAIIRLILPVTVLSGFMNNTPLVAFMLPIFVHVAKKLRVSASKLLIPLSYAAILGGTCTLIGTSTNFVVDGELRSHDLDGLGMWELGWVGIPVSIVGLIYLATIGQKLLPDRRDLLEYAESHRREYTVELIVRANCPLVGKTIRQSGLRDLPGLYVYAIERRGSRSSPVSPDETLMINDILCFSGIVSTIVDAQKIRGLEPIEHGTQELLDGIEASMASAEGVLPATGPVAAPRSGTQLCEVVISPTSPLVGRSVKEADFRSRYNASIIAVHRSGEKLEQKIGQVVLQSGDTLLVDAPEDFSRRWKNSRDFILVSGLEDSAPVDFKRAWLSLAIFLTVVVSMSIFDSTAFIALLGAGVTILAGCLPVREAHRSIELSVLLLIASAIGVSKALDKSGAAVWIADVGISWAQPYGKVAVLAVMVFMTGILTELLSNNACAALMSTLAFAVATKLNMDPRPLLVAVAVTSSYGFATPIGYQTNLMVLGPGGYRFSDYMRVGIPLDLICWIMTIIIIPLVWTL